MNNVFTIIYFLTFILAFNKPVTPKRIIAQPIAIKEIVLPEIVIKPVLSQEELLVEKVLDSIPKRETKFHLIGNKAYTLISPTLDYGKYQINWIHFNAGGLCYGITYQEFLSNPKLQELKARELMDINIRYIKSRGLEVTEKRLHQSWFGIATIY